MYETEFGVSLFAVASILTFVGLVLWSARVLRNTDKERVDLLALEKGSPGARRARAQRSAEAARAEAERANNSKTDFLAVMSHELRTPLTAIMGYEELLSDGITGPVTELQRQQLGRINASAHHLLGLIDEILTFARVDIGRERVRWESMSVNHTLSDAAALVEPMATAKRPQARRQSDERGSVDSDRRHQTATDAGEPSFQRNKVHGERRGSFSDAP